MGIDVDCDTVDVMDVDVRESGVSAWVKVTDSDGRTVRVSVDPDTGVLNGVYINHEPVWPASKAQLSEGRGGPEWAQDA